MKNNKSYNLLTDRWMEAEREKGEGVIKIAPWEIATQLEDNPVASVYFPRADMEPILYEFLIGIFQTFLLPKNNREWRKLYDNPPDSSGLKQKFEPFQDAFEVIDEEEAFMQEKSDKLEGTDPRPISRFPLGAPGENTVDQNRDWIVKEGHIESICPHCAGVLLYGLQSRGPAGGAGYRTSVRGTSFITTLIRGENVWDTVWQNVLPKTQFPVETSIPKSSAQEELFPWMGDLTDYVGRDNSGTLYTPEDGHPLGVYWSTPWRVSFEHSGSSARCDVCGRRSPDLIEDFKKTWYGLNYADVWHHPLSPYTKDEDGSVQYERVHSGLMYRNWKGLLYGEPDDNLEPALPITYRLEREPSSDARVWTYGHRLKRNRIKDWQETSFPLLKVGGQKDEFLHHTKEMIELADYIRQQGVWALHRSLYGNYVEGDWRYPDQEHNSPNWNNGIYEDFSDTFWQKTEGRFFSQVETLRDKLLDGEPFDEVKKEWFTYSKNATIELYQNLSSQENDRFSRSRMMAYRFLMYGLSHEAGGINNRYTTEAGNSISTLWKDEKEGQTSESKS
ncbi:MAG: type I-E CRISPR-associated protein Cse1/CasA [Candidatus Acetothermia bacterium]